MCHRCVYSTIALQSCYDVALAIMYVLLKKQTTVKYLFSAIPNHCPMDVRSICIRKQCVSVCMYVYVPVSHLCIYRAERFYVPGVGKLEISIFQKTGHQEDNI